MLLPVAAFAVGVVAVPELRWSRWRYEVRDEEIDLRHGTVTITRTLIPMLRVQHVDTTRGPLDQLLGLATVVVHTAAGRDDDPRRSTTSTPGGCATRSRRSRGPPMSSEPARLHPAAIAVLALGALREAAFPIVVLLGASIAGRGLDTAALQRSALYLVAGVAIASVMGYLRWRSTSYSRRRAGRALEARDHQHEGDHGPAQPHPGARHGGGPGPAPVRRRRAARAVGRRRLQGRDRARGRRPRRRSSGSARRWARRGPRRPRRSQPER